ncbi:hypothetical protein LS684_21850 (plasmid) [Cytobacillus spongiae]|uniref:hypothetical protein n=1 Tax=Cytobacillus spongiae TaxID=2901381 RepID=UPI001F15C89D|nr:hypothetical protein [Cytobacillus spongiae]UII58259.1 hypothetical protein LS684_21850 [Cytobacillus spongiae]
MPNCCLFINEYILPRIFSSFYYDDLLVPCHNQSIFVSYHAVKKTNVNANEELQQHPAYVNSTQVSHIISHMMSSLDQSTDYHEVCDRPTFDLTLESEEQQPSMILSRIKPRRHKRSGKSPFHLSRGISSSERINYIDHSKTLSKSSYQANSPPDIQPLQKAEDLENPLKAERSKNIQQNTYSDKHLTLDSSEPTIGKHKNQKKHNLSPKESHFPASSPFKSTPLTDDDSKKTGEIDNELRPSNQSYDIKQADTLKKKADPPFRKKDIQSKECVKNKTETEPSTDVDIRESNLAADKVRYQLLRTDWRPAKIVNRDRKGTSGFEFHILRSNADSKKVKQDVNQTEESSKKMDLSKTDFTTLPKNERFTSLHSITSAEKNLKLKRPDSAAGKSISDNRPDSLKLNPPKTLESGKLQQRKQQRNDHPVSLPSQSVNTMAILNKYFTLGDKINVFAGNILLDEKGTFLTAGPDFFIWIDGDGYVRLQIISGGISISQKKKKK